MIKIYRPERGKRELCRTNLRRESEISASPTCVEKARSLPHRPAGISGTNRSCTLRGNRCRIWTASISKSMRGQSGVMQKVQDTGCTDQIGQTVCSCSAKAGRMEYCYDYENGNESIIASERALKTKKVPKPYKIKALALPLYRSGGIRTRDLRLPKTAL